MNTQVQVAQLNTNEGKESGQKTDENVEKCEEWLKKCVIDENSSTCSDGSFATTTNSEFTQSTEDSNFISVIQEEIATNTQIICSENSENVQDLQEILNRNKVLVEKLKVYKSSNVRIGDIIYINGSVYLNQQVNVKQTLTLNFNSVGEFSMISRSQWNAKAPLDSNDVEYLKVPAKFVIISHSATKEFHDQEQNKLIVKSIQSFHMDYERFNDIGYNFLIGADGIVYEGRGWGIRGAHTRRFNMYSVGICFIGCYSKTLPPESSLRQAQKLIEYGIKIGAIADNYTLLAHSQCSRVESPGARLFEEIKGWKNWNGMVNAENSGSYI